MPKTYHTRRSEVISGGTGLRLRVSGLGFSLPKTYHTRRSEVISGGTGKSHAGQKVGDRIIAPYKSQVFPENGLFLPT